MTDPGLIALDWGTTSLRAYLLDRQGVVSATRAEPLGILKVAQGDFAAALQQALGDWVEFNLPMIASGMIGSRQGWREAPYIACPASVAAIGKELLQIPTPLAQPLHVVPGVNYFDNSGVADVMRGEETQIIGQLLNSGAAGGLFVLPGTHSKWVLVADRSIVWFATFMSGEVFALLCEHSILGRLMQGQIYDETAFLRGVAYADTAADQGGLLKKLFSTRTLGLFDQLPGSALHAYLSGLLIGTEIKEALACVAAPVNEAEMNLTILGDSRLTQLYSRALQQRRLTCRPGVEHSVATGLWRIASSAGLLEGSL